MTQKKNELPNKEELEDYWSKICQPKGTQNENSTWLKKKKQRLIEFFLLFSMPNCSQKQLFAEM